MTNWLSAVISFDAGNIQGNLLIFQGIYLDAIGRYDFYLEYPNEAYWAYDVLRLVRVGTNTQNNYCTNLHLPHDTM